MYPEVRLIYMGDFNTDFEINELMDALGLRCIVTEPTHEGSTIDLILTDIDAYTGSQIEPPLGKSKHSCVFTRPSPPPRPTYARRTSRPMPDSRIREFGQWIVT